MPESLILEGVGVEGGVPSLPCIASSFQSLSPGKSFLMNSLLSLTVLMDVETKGEPSALGSHKSGFRGKPFSSLCRVCVKQEIGVGCLPQLLST